MLNKMVCCTLLSLLLSFTVFADEMVINPVSPAPIVQPFIAKYNILHKSDPVGTGVRTLNYLPDGKAQYSYRTEIEWLIFSDNREETSTFYVNNNKVTPISYQYKREGTGPDKDYQWQYNIAQDKATNLKKNKELLIDFPDNIQDKLSYHFQHRLNLIKNPKQTHFVYPVISTSGSIKNYVYQYDAEEEIMLPYGLVKTIRLKREVISKKRVTYAWFAPELNFLMVKLHQIKGGNSQFEAQLTSVSTPSN
jgi:hypothetical protein